MIIGLTIAFFVGGFLGIFFAALFSGSAYENGYLDAWDRAEKLIKEINGVDDDD